MNILFALPHSPSSVHRQSSDIALFTEKCDDYGDQCRARRNAMCNPNIQYPCQKFAVVTRAPRVLGFEHDGTSGSLQGTYNSLKVVFNSATKKFSSVENLLEAVKVQ